MSPEIQRMKSLQATFGGLVDETLTTKDQSEATRQATGFEEIWLIRTTNGDWREYPCYQKYCDMEQLHVQIIGRLSPNEINS